MYMQAGVSEPIKGTIHQNAHYSIRGPARVGKSQSPSKIQQNAQYTPLSTLNENNEQIHAIALTLFMWHICQLISLKLWPN